MATYRPESILIFRGGVVTLSPRKTPKLNTLPFSQRVTVHRPMSDRSFAVLEQLPYHKHSSFSAVALYDFDSHDPDHLAFNKGEILDIVRTQDSGWWAALIGDRGGWAPMTFLLPITDEAAEMLRGQESRDDYEQTAPTVTALPPLNLSAGSLHPSGTAYNQTKRLSPPSPSTHYYSESSSPSQTTSPYSLSANSYDSSSKTITPTSRLPQQRSAPTRATPQWMDKLQSTPGSGPSTPPSHSRSRSDSATVNTSERSAHSRHSTDLKHAASRLSVLPEVSSSSSGSRYRADDDYLTPSPMGDSESSITSSLRSRSRSALAGAVASFGSGKIKQLTGSDDAQALHNAQRSRSQRSISESPWYLRPSYSEAELVLETDGSVRGGTLPALIERLTIDPLRMSQENAFRKTFLVTFKTFTTPETLFNLLVERYQMSDPPGISHEDFINWKERKLRPVQARVLTALSVWLTEARMVTDDPQITPLLKDFLSLVKTPADNAATAKVMLQTVDRMIAACKDSDDPTLCVTAMSTLSPLRRRKRKSIKRKSPKNDPLKYEALELAQHLTFVESRLYRKVSPAECMEWSKSQTPRDEVENLTKFCAMNDRLVKWVKHSILMSDSLTKRADMVDHWIKVAEKCRLLNNISSLSALVASLRSTVISRLHLTWTHVGRKQHIDSLATLTNPSGNFSAYRTLFKSIDGPCVPFIGMYLTNLVHINDQYKDTLDPEPGSDDPVLINFLKRQKLAEVCASALRHQAKPYAPEMLSVNPETLKYVEENLNNTSDLEDTFFWTRSQEVQSSEVDHTDIRKGLEAAGF